MKDKDGSVPTNEEAFEHNSGVFAEKEGEIRLLTKVRRIDLCQVKDVSNHGI